MECNPRIRARVKWLKPVDHYGIAFTDPLSGETKIAHNTPKHPNDKGGGIKIHTVDEFFKTRFLRSAECTYIPSDQVLEYANENYHRPFNLTKFNCEHFAFGIDGSPRSPQLARWFLASAIFIALAFMYLTLFNPFNASK